MDFWTREINRNMAWGILLAAISLFVAMFLSLQAGVWLAFFAAAGWWTWRNPEKGFLLLIIIMPLLPMVKITRTADTGTLIKDVIIMTLFARVFLIPLMHKKLPYRKNILLGPLLMLGGWATIAMLRADNLILGAFRLRDILLFIFLYFAVLYLPVSNKVWRERLGWFSASVMVAVLMGFYQVIAAADSAVLRFDPVREIWIPRMSGMMAHPSIFGHYLLIAFTLFVPLTWFILSEKKYLIGTAWGVISVIILGQIFFTYSRGAWIGVVAAGVAWTGVLIMKYWKGMGLPAGKKWIMAGVVAATALLLLAGASGIGDRTILYGRKLVDPSYRSNQERLEFMARLVAPMTNWQAMVGRGLGDVTSQNLREIEVTTLDVITAQSQEIRESKDRTLVDNQYLKTWVEMGLVGIVIYGWMFYRFAKGVSLLAVQSKKIEITKISRLCGIPQRRDKIQIVVAWWGVGFLAAFMVQGFFIDVWEIFPTNAYFWIIGALVSSSMSGMEG